MSRELNSPDSSRGVLLIGHGTRDAQGTAQFLELGERLAEPMRPLEVAAALLEFQSPTIPEAWNRLVAGGVDHIHVAPLLLFAAGHAKQDIPAVVSRCQATTPSVSYDMARPLSRHPSIVELAVERLEGSLSRLDVPAERTAVVMVGRGNRDPCAQADMRVLTEVVKRRVRCARMVTAFYAMAQPPLADVLEEVASSGRFDAVVVHPHLLFEGRLHQSIVEQTQAASERRSNVRLVTSAYLGPDRRVAEAIAGRIEQASKGPSLPRIRQEQMKT